METAAKLRVYQETGARIQSLIHGEDDLIAMMATIAAELKLAFPHFHWVGFYRVARPGILKIGPYQGGHGCLTIPFGQGVCGRCAREQTTQIAGDVRLLPYHIACSSTTRSEIVVPCFDRHHHVRAVLDVDSDNPDAFDDHDRSHLEAITATMMRQAEPELPSFP